MKRPCQMQMLWHGRSCVGIFNKKVTWKKVTWHKKNLRISAEIFTFNYFLIGG